MIESPLMQLLPSLFMLTRRLSTKGLIFELTFARCRRVPTAVAVNSLAESREPNLS
jgi:hypothetical protein